MSLLNRVLGRENAPAVVHAAAAAVAPFPDVMRGHLTRVEASVRENGARIPVHATLMLFRMCDQLRECVDHMERSAQHGPGPTAGEKLAVEFMVSDYIPSTINAFTLSHAPATERDATFLTQVDTLWGEVRKTVDAVYADDDAALQANAAFLRSKFGGPS